MTAREIVAALVAGWALLTWGVASLTHTWQVWPISAGVSLLALGGVYAWATTQADVAEARTAAAAAAQEIEDGTTHEPAARDRQ